MKKLLFYFTAISFIFFTGCKKESGSTPDLQTNKSLAETFLRKDTTTHALENKLSSTIRANKFLTASTGATGDVSVSLIYQGNGSYQINVAKTLVSFSTTYKFTLYKDGSPLVGPITSTINGTEFTSNLPIGVYYFVVTSDQSALPSYSASFSIIAQPVAPTGMACLYRYYNSLNGQHICTSNWEELASTSQNFTFEKVLGYMYTTATAEANLKPIYRYYNSSTGGHYTTDQNGTFSGYVFEKILGYAGISATADMTKPVTKWHSTTFDDHFQCIPPAVPLGTDYAQDVVDFTFGYLQ